MVTKQETLEKASRAYEEAKREARWWQIKAEDAWATMSRLMDDVQAEEAANREAGNE